MQEQSDRAEGLGEATKPLWSAARRVSFSFQSSWGLRRYATVRATQEPSAFAVFLLVASTSGCRISAACECGGSWRVVDGHRLRK